MTSHMAPQEHVLVFERKLLDELGPFQGLAFEVRPYLRAIFQPGALRFIPRGDAENNPDYKQLIPYVIMTCAGRYLSYIRGKRAGEARLAGNRSIGIGGHINPADEVPLFDSDFRRPYLAALEREIDEEVSLQADHSDRIVALLNDDSNEVGRVHLGIVHLWMLQSDSVTRKEQMITQMSFLALDRLRGLRDSMETWSRICLDALPEITARAQTALPADQLLELP